MRLFSHEEDRTAFWGRQCFLRVCSINDAKSSLVIPSISLFKPLLGSVGILFRTPSLLSGLSYKIFINYLLFCDTRNELRSNFLLDTRFWNYDLKLLCFDFFCS